MNILAYGMMMFSDLKEKNDERLEEIQLEWFRSASYPRKKKKRVRKELLIDYSIFSYSNDLLDGAW